MAPVQIERGMGYVVCPIALGVLRMQAELRTVPRMRHIALLLGATTALLVATTPASAFTCSRHSAAVTVTGGTLTDVTVGRPVADRVDDKGVYDLSPGATAVVKVDRATATITGYHGGKAEFQLSCYQYHSEKVQPLIKSFYGTYRVR